MIIIFMALMSSAFGTQCNTEVFRTENTQVKKLRYTTSNVCSISLSPIDSQDMRYRVHIFTTAGLYLVFNSYSPGSGNGETGARSFYLFPRSNSIDFIQAKPSEGKIEQPNRQFDFDLKTTQIKATSAYKLTHDPVISKSNNGGVSLVPREISHLVLDTGFEFGKPSFEDKNRTSDFIDYKGNRCKVLNSEVFDYIYKNGYLDEVEFKFSTEYNKNNIGTETQLKKFLKKKCRSLRFR